jgi:hypothetical protein
VSESYVWHIVLVRAGKPPSRGERLATLVLSPVDVGRIGRAKLERAVEAERREWTRRAVAANELHDGDGVRVIRERGFVRSLFPAAALPGLTARPSILHYPGPGKVAP